jgi:DNA-binding LacI/PurR family transcriptional regulator
LNGTSNARRRRPTIFDVARRAGVSKSLVSLVLSDSPHVSEANRASVRAAVQELGYRPNAAARGLARGSSGLVGFSLPEMSDPYYEEIEAGVEDASEAAGLRLILGFSRYDERRLRDWLATMLEMRVDGLLVCTWGFDTSFLARAVSDIPTVLLGDVDPNRHFDSVTADDAYGARLAVRHLLELGHRRIAHLTLRPQAMLTSRLEGYLETMREAGLEAEIDVIDAGLSAEGGRKAADLLVQRSPRPTAVFAGADLVAMGLISRLSELGVSVPEDIAVVGYDNTLFADLWSPRLSSVHQSGWDIGRLALQAVLARRAGRTPPEIRPPLPMLRVRRSSVPGA